MLSLCVFRKLFVACEPVRLVTHKTFSVDARERYPYGGVISRRQRSLPSTNPAATHETLCSSLTMISIMVHARELRYGDYVVKQLWSFCRQ